MLLPLLMNLGMFGTQQPEASNWQAEYWKRKPKSKAERDEDERLERIRLGILPPEVQVEAQAAVRAAADAAAQRSAGRMDAADQLRVALEARLAYEQAYRTAYGEAYVAQIVAEHWKNDMKRLARRRKAALLLLH